VIEGRLLVGHLDHERANTIEREADDIAEKVDGGHSQSDEKGEGGDVSTNIAPRSADRQVNRMIYDRKGEEPITPIKFTHFFGRISVSFQSFQRKTDDKANNDPVGSYEADPQSSSVSISNSPLGRTKRLPRRDPLGNNNYKQVCPQKGHPYETDNVTTELIWDREPRKRNSAALRTHDSHAFHAIYDEDQEQASEQRSVVATVRLHRRPGGEQKYLPSLELCRHLFPSFLKELEERSQVLRRNKELNSTKNESSPSKFSEPVVAQSATGDQRTSSEARKSTTTTPLYEVPPSDNSTRVPSLFTHNELVDAIFIYSKDRNLFDTTDMSIIRNDSKLQRLFDCKEMTISVMKSLLLSRRLLRPIVPQNSEHDAAIECTYVMTKDNAHPVPRGISSEKTTSGPAAANATPADNNISTPELEPPSKKRPRLENVEHLPPPGGNKNVPKTTHNKLLTCDIDMDVPSLLHFRTRDILRRIKVREYEYTSSRTKAIRTVQSTGADEDVVRERLDDIVKGRALTSGHTSVLLALAKSAPSGSEARKEAHIDARMGILLDRLEHHSKMAKAYWDIVEACQGNLP